MKNKLVVLVLLIAVGLFDFIVFASAPSRGPGASPDGVASVSQRRRRRRARRKRITYAIKVGDAPRDIQAGAMPKSAEPTGSGSTPMTESIPNVAPAPRPVQAQPGAPDTSAPKIKPPTVQIKPPTK